MRTRKLMSKIDVVTQMLDDLVRGKIIQPSTGERESNLKFIIARKWNSWYPSYFLTQGGCYAFVTRDSGSEIGRNSGVIVIDPGVKFSENLRKYYDIEPHDIRSVIVSHYHPDHTMGLYELLTLTHESHYPCSYYLNRTAYGSFKVFQGKYNKVIEMTEDQVIKLAEYPYSLAGGGTVANMESIVMKTLKTFHEEIGNRHNSLGFVFHILPRGWHKHELVLLGDTDGNEKYLDKYLGYLKDADVAVLHLGSFSEKGYGAGDKHLYKTGLINILNCINCIQGGNIPLKEGKIKWCLNEGIIQEVPNGSVIPSRNENLCKLRSDGDYFKNLKLVIISELGLEMASLDELLRSFDAFKWSTRLYPLLQFSKFFNDDDEYIAEFRKAVEETGGIVDKMNIHHKVFATKAIESIEELIKEIRSNTLSNTLSCEIYNFSIFFGSFLYYLTLHEIVFEEWVKLFSNGTEKKSKKDVEELVEKATRKEKLGKILDNLALINCEDYTKVGYAFKDFIKDFKKQINTQKGFINPFEATVENFLRILIRSVYLRKLKDCNEGTYESVLDDISSLSEYIFYSISNVARFSRSDVINKESCFKEFASFVKSISLFSHKEEKDEKKEAKETFDHICHLASMKLDFSPLLYLLAYELNKQVKSISRYPKLFEDDEYLFSWDNVPGDDSERLKNFLMDDIDIGWAENAEIYKADDNRTISIVKDDENSTEIKIGDGEEKAILNISDGRTYYLQIKNVDHELCIYKDDLMLSLELINILRQYSSQKVKYFLSDIGIEIDFSRELKIKDSTSSWINVGEAEQFVDKRGNFRFV